MLNTFAVYVENKPGVLNRVASLVRRRAFNIESLTVGHTETAGVSRMTVVVDTDEYGARRLEAHLHKVVPVRRVDNITSAPSIARDLALIKVAAIGDARTHVMQLVDVYRARIVDVSPHSLVIESTGTEDKIDSVVEVLRPYGVIDRVGPPATSRSHAKAQAAGLTVGDVRDVSKWADAVMILIPDTSQGKVYREEIEPNLAAGNMLM